MSDGQTKTDESSAGLSVSPSTSLWAAVGPSITMAATQALIEEAAGNMAKAEWWRGLFSSPRFACSVCGHRFRVNIDGCPKCGAQKIIKEKE